MQGRFLDSHPHSPHTTLASLCLPVCSPQLQGNTAELANHHSASRVLQWCLREGSEADKARLLAEVRAHIVELSKSKYGRHVVQKVISLAKKEDVPGECCAGWLGVLVSRRLLLQRRCFGGIWWSWV